MGLRKFESVIRRVAIQRSGHFAAGFDCAVNGPNEENCDFKLFSSKDATFEWEQGKAAGEKFLKERSAQTERGSERG